MGSTPPTGASVIVPARNRGPALGACLAALCGQRWLPGHREVIVVANGPTDVSAEIARAAGATVIGQTNRGRAAARNVGYLYQGLLFTSAVLAIPIVAGRRLAVGAGMVLGLLDAPTTRRWIRWQEAIS